MSVAYRQGVGSDAPELSNIAFAAKRDWGYPEGWIALWADELTITPAYIETSWVIVAVTRSQVVGWCGVVEEQSEFWLDYCWVLPAAAGSGIGSALVRRALAYTAQAQAGTLKVLSDPNAVGFYERFGFRAIGDRPSKPSGRRLPLLEVKVGNVT